MKLVSIALATAALAGCHAAQDNAQQRSVEQYQAEAKAAEAEANSLMAGANGAGSNTAAAAAVPANRPAAAPAGGGGLKIGEYACYGGSTGSGSGQLAGGRSVLLIGLGFKVLSGGNYTDLDGKNPGTFTVSGSTVAFQGGIHGGEAGRDLAAGRFVLGSKVVCEPF